MDGAVSAFDRSRFELIDDPDTRLQVLFETHSEQRVYLEQGRWALAFGDDGAGFVQCGPDSQWCDDLFEDVVTEVVTGEDAAIFVHINGGVLSTLAHYKRRHTVMDVPLLIRGTCLDIVYAVSKKRPLLAKRRSLLLGKC